MTKNQRAVFFSATIAYSMYYVCRLSLSVIKAPLIKEGVLTEFQLGLIGSGLFYAYAVGKCVNGFLADRANLNRFLTLGLLGSAVVNLSFGFRPAFTLLAILWLVNGWCQSVGAPACVVGLARWFEPKERGTYYGLWSATHNIGEGITFVTVALVSTHFGWRWGFWGAALCGFAGATVAHFWFHNRPSASAALSNPDAPSADTGAVATSPSAPEKRSVGREQWRVLRDPVIWLIAAASALMYVARYAINSWGMFLLEFGKGYTRVEAGTLISLSAVAGVAGTVASGWIGTRWFQHNRFLPAVLAGMLNAFSLAALLATPGGHRWIDGACLIGFGVSIGALICYLGGLLAIDSVPKEAAGAALGVVGIASYLGAGLQDVASGFLIEKFRTGAGAQAHYDFVPAGLFWVGASVASVLVTTVIWRRSRRVRPPCEVRATGSANVPCPLPP